MPRHPSRSRRLEARDHALRGRRAAVAVHLDAVTPGTDDGHDVLADSTRMPEPATETHLGHPVPLAVAVRVVQRAGAAGREETGHEPRGIRPEHTHDGQRATAHRCEKRDLWRLDGGRARRIPSLVHPGPSLPLEHHHG